MLPRGIEEALFKRAHNGWIFSAPNPWLVGRRSYLVNDAQKAVLGRCVRRGRYLRMLAVLPLLGCTFLLAPYLLDNPSATTWLLLALLLVGFSFVMNLADYLPMRGELGNLMPTTERIGLIEMHKTQAQAMSVPVLAAIGLLNALASVMMLAQWLMSAHAPFALMGAVGSGLLAAPFLAMLVMRLRSQGAS